MLTSLSKVCFLIMIGQSLLHAYSFSMHCDNPDLMVGEKTHLTLHFSYQDLEEYEIEEPHFDDMKLSLLSNEEYHDKNGTWHAKQRYALTPYTSGTFTLHPLKTHIEMIEKKDQSRYNKNKYLKKFDCLSNPIKLHVKALPQGVHITGNYQLITRLDKNTTSRGTPVHFSLRLKGEGNLENLDFLTLHIPHAMVYETAHSKFEKRFDIVAEQNFTIPAIYLQYYQQDTHKIVLLSSAPQPIYVQDGISPKQPKPLFWWMIFPLGLLGLLFYYTYHYLKDDAHSTFKKSLKRCKDKEALLKKMLPYLHKNRQLTRLLYQLEESDVKEFKPLKKEILKHF